MNEEKLHTGSNRKVIHLLLIARKGWKKERKGREVKDDKDVGYVQLTDTLSLMNYFKRLHMVSLRRKK